MFADQSVGLLVYWLSQWSVIISSFVSHASEHFLHMVVFIKNTRIFLYWKRNSLWPCMSVDRSVGPLVVRSVGRSVGRFGGMSYCRVSLPMLLSEHFFTNGRCCNDSIMIFLFVLASFRRFWNHGSVYKNYYIGFMCESLLYFVLGRVKTIEMYQQS